MPIIDIGAHGGVFGGGKGKVKFPKVTASLTAPSNPQEYDIWLECSDTIRNVYFSDTNPTLNNIGDVHIGTAGLEIVTKLIKGGNKTLNITPITPKSTNRKIITSDLVDMYANIGAAKVKRSDGVYYVNAYVFVNGVWVQFSIDNNVSLVVFYRITSTSTYKVAFIDNNDNFVKTQNAQWSGSGNTSSYGYAHWGLFYDPIRKKIIVSGIDGISYEFDPFDIFDPSINRRNFPNVGTYRNIIAIDRYGHIFAGGYDGGFQGNTYLGVIDYNTGQKTFENTKVSTPFFRRALRKTSKFIDKYKLLVNIGGYDDYNALVGFDTSNVDTGGGMPKVFSITYPYSGSNSYVQEITANKDGIITFYSPIDNAFIQVDYRGVELRRVDATSLNIAPHNGTNIPSRSFTEDQYGNFYAVIKHQVGGYALVKLDSNFNVIWEIQLVNEGSDVVVTKEGIVYVWTGNKIQKYNKDGQFISEFTEMDNVNALGAWTTLSPSISAFPEYW